MTKVYLNHTTDKLCLYDDKQTNTHLRVFVPFDSAYFSP